MMQALRIAATGMYAQQTNVDVLSNNIANLATTGFKQQNVAFNDLVYQSRVGVGSITSSLGTIAPTGVQIGLGVGVGGIYPILKQGALNRTDNDFDIALQGKGFFKISMPDGTTQFTRDGSFQIDNTGQMVTKQGHALDPAITVPSDAVDLTISADGVVSALVAGTNTNLGTITIATFANESGLKNKGNNLYAETEASGTAQDTTPGLDGTGELLQGFLEASNVDPIESVTRLITAQRAYELNSRVISTADEMLGTVTQIT
ncbi:MAG: flagellar basal-body rod protein FlgG [Alphaproteobacteria bacterium]